VIPDQFTTAYESVLVNGTVALDLSDSEKLHALELILDKYSPDDKAVGMKYAEKSFQRTCVMRLDIASVSGKCKVTK
jgi:nitroimidazol reductase NimA-like FMN-containing flavoprotein (pyridoxamine 5'-phosphate oxidase superfamily)